jgi:predicted esterase
MKIKNILGCLILLVGYSTQGQDVIDGGFDFETVNNKKYSLYIPSGYDEGTPHQLMLGLHPLNTSRWDGEAWRDTLINFAESNDLILVCPDGGPDGRIDDAIDTSFTTVLLDSVAAWYNINQNEKYIMGFSWGGKTTYTYGLRRTDQFAGYIVIGAAIQFGEVADIISNAKDENFYLVHGSQDAVSTRYTPLLNGLNDNNACTESILMSGIGHTIDFPNRNQILSEAFQWIKNNNCGTSSIQDINLTSQILVSPNPSHGKINISNTDELILSTIQITNLAGKKLRYDIEGSSIQLTQDTKGIIILTARSKNGDRVSSKVLIE